MTGAGGAHDPRAAAAGAVRHGVPVPRGQQVGGDGLPHHGRFGKMFPILPPSGIDAAENAALAKLMRKRTDPPVVTGTAIVPAGFTYLGQFVDHDITFDPTSKLNQRNDPRALANFRTPRFDLDSLYGSGPRDQPYLYDRDAGPVKGVKLLVGHNTGAGDAPDDLPRNEQGRALVGDPRNDENLIVAQLHLLFIRFHNAVVEHVWGSGKVSKLDVFDEAQRIVRWHYQWLVTHEFLCHVVGHDMANSVLEQDAESAPAVHRRYYRWSRAPFMPVEFSGAAYRFGHSMVRPDYFPNSGTTAFPIFKISSKEETTWEGSRRIPVELAINWKRFFALRSDFAPMLSRPINPYLAEALFSLPPGTGEDRSLAFLNLRRASALGLPSGQCVAAEMEQDELNAGELHLRAKDVDAVHMSDKHRRKLLKSTPLWYYLLCEAERADPGPDGEHLGRIGGQIVAEVLVGLLEGDPDSYLSQSARWRPEPPIGNNGDFTMADLIRFTNPPPPPEPA